MDPVAYVGLFAAVVATWIAVSGPGEAALVGAGSVAAAGNEQIGTVLAVAFVGTVTGSVAAYWIGRAAGRRLLLWRGPLLDWRTRTLARCEAMAQRRGFLAALLTPGWFAGINEISLRPFLAGSALSGLAWTLAIGLGTFYVGPSLIATFDDVGRWGTIGLAAAAVAATLVLLRGRVPRLRMGDGR
jgi:membrane protein DedA with SNARE-associated domain